MSVESDLPRLGRYQVLSKIAQGGMAEIFLAKAIGAMGFERLTAIKLIHSHLSSDEEFINMFIDEARISMHLHHRNIVQTFDLDKSDDTYFIAMEYVHGVNLYDLYEGVAAKDRWVELPMALYIIAEACKGLHFAHTRLSPDGRPMGIVHRDISPQNILLSFEGEVKITDFGIAKAAERLHHTTPGIVKGKYAYMAPEVLQERPADPRVDVFAAGVVLYELLVGENPFAGPSAVDTIDNVQNIDVPAPTLRGAPGSPELDAIVLKALAKDPDQRYQSAAELAEALTDHGLNLTMARRDIAAGDASIATLLAELFPDRANRIPGASDKLIIPMGGAPLEDEYAQAATAQSVDAIDDDEYEDEGGDATLLNMTPVSVPAAGHLAFADSTARNSQLHEEPATVGAVAAIEDIEPEDRTVLTRSLHGSAPEGVLDVDPRLADALGAGGADREHLRTAPMPGSFDAATIRPGDRASFGDDASIVLGPHSSVAPRMRTTAPPFIEPHAAHQSKSAPDTAPQPPALDPGLLQPVGRASGGADQTADPSGTFSGSLVDRTASISGADPTATVPPSGGGTPLAPRAAVPSRRGVHGAAASDPSMGASFAGLDLGGGPNAMGGSIPAGPPRQPSAPARRGGRTSMIAGVLVFLAVAVVAATFVVRQLGVDKATISITSNPSGAAVDIDGVRQPSPTPLNSSVSPNKMYTVEITAPGHQPYRREIRPLAGVASEIHAELEPK